MMKTTVSDYFIHYRNGKEPDIQLDMDKNTIYTELDRQEYQTTILKKIINEIDIYAYVLLYSLYSNDVSDLQMPYEYTGYLILPRNKDASIVLEFDKKYSGWDEEREYWDTTKTSRFIGRLFGCSTMFLLDLNPQEVQDIYYEGIVDDVQYKESFLALVEPGNDGYRMNFHMNKDHPKYEKLAELVEKYKEEYMPDDMREFF